MASIHKFEVGCPSCQSIVTPETQGKMKQTVASAAILGFLGFLMGSVVGVATAGFGFVAWIFTVPLGLYFGYKFGGWVAEKRNGVTCPDCKSHF